MGVPVSKKLSTFLSFVCVLNAISVLSVLYYLSDKSLQADTVTGSVFLDLTSEPAVTHLDVETTQHSIDAV